MAGSIQRTEPGDQTPLPPNLPFKRNSPLEPGENPAQEVKEGLEDSSEEDGRPLDLVASINRLHSIPRIQFQAQVVKEAAWLRQADERNILVQPGSWDWTKVARLNIFNSWKAQGIWVNKWSERSVLPNSSFKHEVRASPEVEEPSAKQPTSPGHEGDDQPKCPSAAEWRERQLQREASRPLYQFLHQLSLEREHILLELNPGRQSFSYSSRKVPLDINTMAYERLKSDWIRWKIWDTKNWAILPGMLWMHERQPESAPEGYEDVAYIRRSRLWKKKNNPRGPPIQRFLFPNSYQIMSWYQEPPAEGETALPPEPFWWSHPDSDRLLPTREADIIPERGPEALAKRPKANGAGMDDFVVPQPRSLPASSSDQIKLDESNRPKPNQPANTLTTETGVREDREDAHSRPTKTPRRSPRALKLKQVNFTTPLSIEIPSPRAARTSGVVKKSKATPTRKARKRVCVTSLAEGHDNNRDGQL